jgi:hypothetical protein
MSPILPSTQQPSLRSKILFIHVRYITDDRSFLEEVKKPVMSPQLKLVKENSKLDSIIKFLRTRLDV